MASPGAGLEGAPHSHVLKSFVIYPSFSNAHPPRLRHGHSLIAAQA